MTPDGTNVFDGVTLGSATRDQLFTIEDHVADAIDQSGLGFVRLKSHAPSSHEIAANPDMAQVSRIIDEWLSDMVGETVTTFDESTSGNGSAKSTR